MYSGIVSSYLHPRAAKALYLTTTASWKRHITISPNLRVVLHLLRRWQTPAMRKDLKLVQSPLPFRSEQNLSRQAKGGHKKLGDT